MTKRQMTTENALKGVKLMSMWRATKVVAAGVLGASLLALIAASPVVNQTVAIVDPYNPERQALVTAGGALTVTAAGEASSAAVSVTRTNDTNVYAANDVIGAATGSTAALTFPTLGPSGKEIIITSVALEVDITAIVSGMTSFRLYLYNITPPSALGDNAPFDLPSGDRASYLGYVDLGSPVDLGSTLYVELNGVQKQVKLAGTSLFGYLVTIGTWTPAASSVFTVTLHTVAP